MTKLKKFTSVFVAMMMVLMMSIGVFAKANTTITITNANTSKDYEIYKVFDIAKDDVGDSIYYTVAAGSAWADAIDDDNDAPFELGDVVGGVRRVSLKNEDEKDSVITNWVKKQIEKNDNIEALNIQPAKNSSANTVTFTVSEDGYYFVSTTNGTLVAVDNLIGTTITISDKSLMPSWDPENPGNPDDPYFPDPEDKTTALGKFVANVPAQGENATYKKSISASIGETELFKINAFVPTYAGGNKVVSYTIKDVYDESFTPDISTIKVYLNGSKTALDEKLYSVTKDGNSFSVSYKIADIASYTDISHVSITYEAILNENTVDIANNNDAHLIWNQIGPNEDLNADPEDPNSDYPRDPDGNLNPDGTPTNTDDKIVEKSSTVTNVYGFKLQKVDGDKNEITGAEFSVSDANGVIKFVEDGTDDEFKTDNVAAKKYRVALESEEGAIEAIPVGHATIWGLKEGEYTLTETEVPNGYNQAAPTKVKVDAENHNVTTQVVNLAGIQLPSTGGIGTRVFYVTGAVVMLGAVVLLVAKKRTSDK